jgi:molecular chaperone HtpG
MSAQHNFQVNLRGVIDLLSDHLYSGPHVYLRELLQNSVDAITARRQAQAGYQGEIRLEILGGGEQESATLLIHDNGIGLTESEVHEFLATIGQSSKRDPLSSDEFIGQFGIGLLSAFVVSEEIVVITRSVQDASPTVQWKGRSDGTYTLDTLKHDFEPGTQVFLKAKAGCEDYFLPEFVCKMARQFARYLPHPITVSWDDQQRSINETPPWQAEPAGPQSQTELLLEFGRDEFDMEFVDAIPIASQAGGIRGVALVLPHASSLAARRAHSVYLKGMFLSDKVDNLLPEWAFFVKCVLNVTELKPTAAREAFHESEQLEQARDALGEGLRQYLLQLARTDQSRLDRIIDLHYLPIKALAVQNDDFYRMFIDWLPFETSLGQLTLGELRQREPVVRYVSSRDQFRQIAGVAAAQSICVINSGYTYDTELIEKLPEAFADRPIERMDVSELTQSFEDLSLEERESVFDFVKFADLVLQPFRCAAEVKKFEPGQLPTLYTSNDSATFLRSIEQTKETADDLWSGVLDQFSESPAHDAYSQLCLNFQNPLIRRIAQVKDRQLIRRTIEMLYVQALLLGHYPLKAAEMKLLSEGLLGLIEIGLQAHGDES